MNPELTKEKVLSNLQDFGYKVPTGDVREKYVAPAGQVGGAYTNSGIISQDGTTPITADSLTPETPIVTPNAPTPTASLGVSTQAEQYAKSSKANADAEQQRLDKQQEALQSSEQSIADIITGMGEAGNKKQQAYQDQGLIDIKKSSDSVRTAMESANLATRRRIEELQKNNPEGQSASALSAQIRDIEAKNASYQADQAIVLSALNRDFDTAKSFIDAKVDAETEQMKATLDARTFLYENNKDRFTKAEQRKIEADLRDENRAYQEEKETKKTLEENKIEAMKNAQEQGAPTSIIQAISKSKTVEEVITNAGQYGGDIKRKLEIQKLNKELNQTGIDITNPNAGQYKQALNVILGSSKLTKEQKADVVNAVNTGDDPFQVIKNQAQIAMGQTNATKLQDLETAKQQLEEIDKNIKAFYANNGDTGVFSGNFEKTLNKLGKTSDPNLVGIATEIALAMQAYRLAVTGTAASVQEDARIDDIFPGITSGEILNNARTKATINSFDTKIDAYYKNKLGNVYDELKKANSADALVSPKVKIDEYIKANPQEAENVAKLYETISPAFGNKPPTDEQIAEYLNL